MQTYAVTRHYLILKHAQIIFSQFKHLGHNGNVLGVNQNELAICFDLGQRAKCHRFLGLVANALDFGLQITVNVDLLLEHWITFLEHDSQRLASVLRGVRNCIYLRVLRLVHALSYLVLILNKSIVKSIDHNVKFINVLR